MSGATAPRKQKKEINEFSMDGKRETDEWVAKYKREQAKQKGPGGKDGGGTAGNTEAAKKVKKSVRTSSMCLSSC
jgi:hypothetical protein